MSQQRPTAVAAVDATDARACAGRRIVSIAGVCGGAPCLEGTRVPVWVLARARDFNKTLDEFLLDYPFLSEADLRSAWDYADAHVDEIQRAIQENEDV